ncbi:hypothetical protein IEQ34_000687 [Dendrobium chrysotoxum]|uniref:Uncharacterized protein n=1 Tax=Dendrobium chrysotoxum TaxID=161865 RepID=A0AAV7HRX2_DENCH|nr:hypothetical protein IEQ34_000687 [Dendrobium chrysotoxum]
MARQNLPNILEQNTYGIILRTSSIFSSRYAYFPLPCIFPTKDVSELDNIITDSLANAPNFPDITILDSVYSNILYQAYNSFPNFCHVYNLINRSHFALSFPYYLVFVTATILICDCSCSCFSVLVVCINEHPNPLFAKDGDNRTRPIVFYLYTSKSKNWSLVPNDHNLTSDHLLPNRRSPTHFGGDIVYIDLTKHFVITYNNLSEKIKLIPKLVSTWEQGSNKLDEATRYGKCKGRLHCVKFNPIKVQIEVYIWLESPIESWRLVEGINITNVASDERDADINLSEVFQYLIRNIVSM